MTDCTDGHEWSMGIDWAQKDSEKTCITILRKDTDDVITIMKILYGEVAEYFARLHNEHASLKRDFIGVHQISQDVISLAEEIRKACPQGKIEKRWVLEARARGFSMRMLCERRKADALIADTQEQEDGFCPACDAGVGHCNGPHKGNDEIPF